MSYLINILLHVHMYDLSQHLTNTVYKINISYIIQVELLMFYCCSVAHWSPTLCNPMNCSMPGFSVLHYLPEFAQVHVQIDEGERGCYIQYHDKIIHYSGESSQNSVNFLISMQWYIWFQIQHILISSYNDIK